jgi:hypothetical protein
MESKKLEQKPVLKNGNRQGNPNAAPRCKAKTRKGTECMAPAMPNGRCRFHGGKSTGPKTTEGRKKSAEANLKHGLYSLKYKMQRNQILVLKKFIEIMARPGTDSPYLDIMALNHLEREQHKKEPDFLENIDFDNLSIEDKIKVYKKLVYLLNQGTKASTKLLKKIEKQNKKRM